MSRIVIIGASAAGHTLAAKLREANKDNSITLITEESYLAYDRRMLLDFVFGLIKEKELYLCDKDYYRDNNINFLSPVKVTGLNPQKKIVYCRDNEKSVNFNYDILIICSGRRFILPQIEGARKPGVFNLNSLDDYKELAPYLIGDTVCLAGNNKFSWDMARALAVRKKEVKLIAVAENPIPQPLEGIEVINSQITEVIGESQAQAIRLKEGKLIGVAAVIFAEELKSNAEFVKGAGLDISSDYILVDNRMQTNIPDVYACGQIARYKDSINEEKSWNGIIQEAQSLAETLLTS
ncbi:MAG: FAD-dependent oxidoreductase [Candidatus Omnitrophota bacterium]|nr:FAD-dependent oxidoreductase [Candidatus Omnitrophota bacterium]